VALPGSIAISSRLPSVATSKNQGLIDMHRLQYLSPVLSITFSWEQFFSPSGPFDQPSFFISWYRMWWLRPPMGYIIRRDVATHQLSALAKNAIAGCSSGSSGILVLKTSRTS
jgi:hypothetical protein